MRRLETKSKRRAQRWRANSRAVMIGAGILAVGFLAGTVVGFFARPAKAAYTPPLKAEKAIAAAYKQDCLEGVSYHGKCRITAYCPCEVCCGSWAEGRPVDEEGNPIVYGAGGTILTPGVSVACSLPYGTEIKIDGLPGTYIVEDRTAEWIQDKYNGMTVDIYMDSHEACYELLEGLPEWMDVYVVEEADE